MMRTRSVLALSAALLAAGAASSEARADGSAVSRDTRPPTIQKESGDEHRPQLFAQPLAAKLATAVSGAAAGGTSRATSKVTFSGGQTDAEADVEIDI